MYDPAARREAKRRELRLRHTESVVEDTDVVVHLKSQLRGR